MVTQRNWLDVYPYTTWGSTANLPVFREGQTFLPHELLLKEVRLDRTLRPVRIYLNLPPLPSILSAKNFIDLLFLLLTLQL